MGSMSMKFWFGKKDTEPGGASEGAGDAQIVPSLFPGVEQACKREEEPVVVPAPKVPDPEVKKDAEAAVVGLPAGQELAPVAAVPPPATPVPVPALPASAETAKVVLKAVGGSVRATPLSPTVPVGAAVSQTPAAGAAARPQQMFGLRPKVGASSVQAPAAGGAEGNKEEARTSVERDADEAVVRPKPDQRVLYYQLMNGLYDALLILDDQGHVVDCSTRVEEVLGYSREDAWDLPIGKIITGMSAQMFGHLKRNLAENHHILIDARCFRKDGSSFTGEVGVSTLSLTRGDNMVFAIRNVERRKSAIEDLRKSRAAMDVALASTFVCDPDGFFQMVNQALLEAFGIPDEAQAKSVRFMDLLPDAARFFLRAACGEKLREKMQIPTPEGTPIKIELALMPVQSGQNITAVAGSILQL